MCSPVGILENNTALRERLEGVTLPQVKKYTVKSDGYGKLFECTKILCAWSVYFRIDISSNVMKGVAILRGITLKHENEKLEKRVNFEIFLISYTPKL